MFTSDSSLPNVLGPERERERERGGGGGGVRRIIRYFVLNETIYIYIFLFLFFFVVFFVTMFDKCCFYVLQGGNIEIDIMKILMVLLVAVLPIVLSAPVELSKHSRCCGSSS